MAAHTKVSWAEHAKPWIVEETLISSVPLSLNLAQNPTGEFYAQLKAARAAVRNRYTEASV